MIVDKHIRGYIWRIHFWGDMIFTNKLYPQNVHSDLHFHNKLRVNMTRYVWLYVKRYFLLNLCYIYQSININYELNYKMNNTTLDKCLSTFVTHSHLGLFSFKRAAKEKVKSVSNKNINSYQEEYWDWVGRWLNVTYPLVAASCCCWAVAFDWRDLRDKHCIWRYP